MTPLISETSTRAIICNLQFADYVSLRKNQASLFNESKVIFLHINFSNLSSSRPYFFWIPFLDCNYTQVKWRRWWGNLLYKRPSPVEIWILYNMWNLRFQGRGVHTTINSMPLLLYLSWMEKEFYAQWVCRRRVLPSWKKYLRIRSFWFQDSSE